MYKWPFFLQKTYIKYIGGEPEPILIPTDDEDGDDEGEEGEEWNFFYGLILNFYFVL